MERYINLASRKLSVGISWETFVVLSAYKAELNWSFQRTFLRRDACEMTRPHPHEDSLVSPLKVRTSHGRFFGEDFVPLFNWSHEASSKRKRFILNLQVCELKKVYKLLGLEKCSTR